MSKLDQVDQLGMLLLQMTDEERALFLSDLDEESWRWAEEAMTRPELQVALDQDPNADWRQNPATFAHHLTRGRYRLWRYVLLLAEKFRQAVDGESTRQIWNLPSRYGKSKMASQWGPSWTLDRDPRFRLILVSYGDTLARENALAVRSNLRDNPKEVRAQLRQDQQRADRFVTIEGGGILARGLMSGIIGFGGDGIVFDDPYKDWQEAHSQARRDLVDNQYKAVVTTRLETDTAFVIVVQTRWHEDDQCGRLQKRMEDGTGEAWDVVRIPAIAERFDPDSTDPMLRVPDPLDRQPGEPIERERFSLVAVKNRHLSLGSYLTAGMEQQRPAPEEGGEIKRAWWKLEDRMPQQADEWVTSWDMKLKDKEGNDFVVGTAWARTGSDRWCVDMLRGKWNFVTTQNAIALMRVRHPLIGVHIIENTGNGPEVMAELRDAKPDYVVSDEVAGLLAMTERERKQVNELRRRGMTGLIANNPKGSKLVRIRLVTGEIEGGHVHLPRRASWLGVYLDETAAFPNGATDDICDTISQALLRFAKGQSSVGSAHKGQTPKTPVARPPGVRTAVPIRR